MSLLTDSTASACDMLRARNVSARQYYSEVIMIARRGVNEHQQRTIYGSRHVHVRSGCFRYTQGRSEWFAKRARANHERRRADADVSEVSHHHKSIVSTNTELTNTDRRNTTDPGRVRPQRPDLARAPKSVYKDTSCMQTLRKR